MSLHISIIYGSTREGRLGIKFAKYLHNEFNKRGNITNLIDPLDLKLDPLIKRYADFEKDSVPKALEQTHKTLSESDAFVIVSGEYNHFIPPALVNLLNHFYDEYQKKPSAVTTYSVSPFGGARVSSPLRAFLAQLGMPPISSMLHAPFVGKNFNSEGERISNDAEERHKEFEKFATEVEWYANALKNARRG